jgi:hypothetical protein
VSSHVLFQFFVEEPALGYIDFATDDGLETLVAFLAFVYFAYIIVELFDTHHVAVVGNGYTFHPVGNGFVNEFLYGSLTIEDGVLGVDM